MRAEALAQARGDLLPRTLPKSVTPEMEDALLAVFSTDPDKLTRMQAKLAKSKECAKALEALAERRNYLMRRNSALRHMVTPVPELPEDEQLRPSTYPAKVPSSHVATTVSQWSDTSTEPVSDANSTRTGEPGVIEREEEDTDFGDSTVNHSTSPVPEDWGKHEPHSGGEPSYQYCGPEDCTGAVITPLFPDGLLYRLVHSDGHWTFYNDTRYYAMCARYVLARGSSVQPGPGASLIKRPDGTVEVSVRVYPEQTVTLLTGTVTGFENKSEVCLMSEDDVNVFARGSCLTSAVPTVQKSQLGAIEAKVRCEKGGGCDGSAVLMSSEDAVAVCVAHDLQFVDPEFFPDHSALYRSSSSSSLAGRGHQSDSFWLPPLHWRTPAGFLPVGAADEACLFRGAFTSPAVGPVEVAAAGRSVGASSCASAGSLFPDHAFLSVLCAVANRHPHCFRRLFAHPCGAARGARERELGAYRFSLCRSGWWHSTVVDSYLPATARCPEFARCPRDIRVLWPCYAEKACAKARGSYAGLLSASVPEIVAALTGAPCVDLRSVWPVSVGHMAGRHLQQLKRFEDCLWSIVRRDGAVLMRTFSLLSTTTRAVPAVKGTSVSVNDSAEVELEAAYKAMGIRPSCAVAVRVVENIDGHTMLCVRQSAGQDGTTAWVDMWRATQKPWMGSTLEAMIDIGDGRDTWIAAADVTHYFESAYAYYPLKDVEEDTQTCLGNGTIPPSVPGELRVRGCFKLIAGATTCTLPDTCLRIDVIAPTRVVLNLVATVTPTGGGASGACEESLAISSSLSGGDAAVVALQLTGSTTTTTNYKEQQGQACVRTDTTPDIFAEHKELRYSYGGCVALGFELIPEQSPHFVVPRARLTSAYCTTAIPYTLVLTSNQARQGCLSFQFVNVMSCAFIFTDGCDGETTTDVIDPLVDCTPVTREAQCRWGGEASIKTYQQSEIVV